MRSVGWKFTIAVALAMAVFVGLEVYHARETSRSHVERLAAQQAEMALEFDLAIRRYVAEYIRPAMAEKLGADEFIPEAMSTSYVARSIFEDVRRKFPDHVIKFSSDDPRNPANLAGPEERRIIRYFNENPSATRWSGEIRLAGKPHYAQFSPRRMRERCLRCHGDPKDAPESMIARYGATAGFHRPVGQVVGVDVVGIPMASIRSDLASATLKQSALSVVALVVLFAVILGMFRFLVGRRLGRVADHFRRAAAADSHLSAPLLEGPGRDEIGAMADAYNAMATRLNQSNELLEREVAERTASLRESEARYRSLFESSRDALMTCAPPSWRFTSCNRAAAEMFGVKDEAAFIQLGPWDVSPPTQPDGRASDDKAKEMIETAMREGAHLFEWVHRKYRGESFPASVLLTRTELAGQTVVQATVRDITAEKRAKEQLRRAKDRADAANVAKSQFLANMSHEIRTPMTAVLGYADLLREDLQGCSACAQHAACSTRRENLEHIEIIRRNGQHLLSLINDILDLSKIEAGRMVADVAPCSPVAVVADVASIMRVRAHARGIALEVTHEGPLPKTIRTDRSRLKQALVNLVGNAVKFTEEGSVRIVTRLVADWREDQPGLCFRVEDTGIGISPDRLADLFDPFTQADASTSRHYGGTGLGLAITRRVVALLGGELDVQSTPGRGSTFSIIVPGGRLEDARMLPQPSEVRESSLPDLPGPGHETRLEGLRVLLAEDGPANQLLIRRILERAGADVEVVENGRLAVDHALAGRHDVILMDMQMPEMDGYAATRALRKAGYPGAILSLTAHAMSGDRRACLAAGCNEHLTKPIDRERLIRMVKAHATPGRASAEPAPTNKPPSPDPAPAPADAGAALEPVRSALHDDPDVAGILDEFVAGLGTRLAAMAKALAEDDPESLRRLAHQLKGAGGGYGYPPLTEAARTLEQAARAHDADVARLALEELRALCAAIQAGRNAAHAGEGAPHEGPHRG